MAEKLFKQIKIIAFTSIILSLPLFAYIVFFVHKYVEPSQVVALERWAIILTLGGIFSSLRFLHPRYETTETTSEKTALNKYKQKYILRQTALITIFLANIGCLYITGVKNFTFLAFITIFAMFLCIPSRRQLQQENE